MKRVIIRDDLMSISDYSKKFNISRPTIYARIKDGLLVVERIGTTEYIKIK